MNVAVAFRRAALALVLLATAAYSASERSPWALVLGGLAAVLSTFITEGPRGRALPAWTVRVGVLAAMAWGGFEFLQRPSPAEAPRIVGGVVLATLLMKLFERKAASDWRQVLALTVVLVVASALGSADFVVGVLVIVYAGVAILAVMLYQLLAGAERAAADRRTAAIDPRVLPPFDVPGGLAQRRHFRRVVAVSVVLGLAMSVGVFVMFPRESVFGGGGAAARQSGFNAELWLWGGDRISLSSRVAMTVQLLDPAGEAAELANPLRLRGAALDRYSPTEARWIASRVGQGDERALDTGAGQGFQWLSAEARAERTNVWTQVVEMRSLASDHVFSAWLPLAIQCDDSRTFLFSPSGATFRERTAGSVGRPQRYSVRMQAFPLPRLVQSVVPAAAPVDTPSFPVAAVRTEAVRVLGELGVDTAPVAAGADPDARWERNRRIARALEGWLSGPNFRYTTDLSGFRRIRGQDPIALFLLRYRAGHCEYFASALAAMCQAAGVEARVVAGWMATEYDPVSACYVVRESSAHAWVEVRTGEWQWTTFDPSPMGDLLAIQRANRTWLDRFRWLLDPLEFAWNSRFASFDSGAQAELAERLGGGARGAVDRAKDLGGELVQRANRWFQLGPAGAIWLGLVVVVAVIAVVAVVTVVRRSRRVRRELGAGRAGTVRAALLARDVRFYLDALDVLAAAGVPKPRARTPRMHADAVRARCPDAGATWEELVDRFYDVRYGGRRLNRGERAALDALVARLRAELSRGYTRRSAA